MNMKQIFRHVELKRKDIRTVQAFLAPLKYKNSVTNFHYQHSLRVAVLAEAIATFTHLDGKPALLAGLLHDIGKCQIVTETLGKTEEWTDRDAKIIRRHASLGYEMCRDRFDFTAAVVLWVHRFQKDGYPIHLPKPLHAYSQGTTLLIAEYGRLVAIADVYDALHRVNSKFGHPLNEQEIQEKMFSFNPDRHKLIIDLYAANIL